MIQNVVLHMTNEQPLLADVFDLPGSTDAGLLCTNLRLLDGKRPVFIDRADGIFYFPYHVIRFLEITAGAMDRHRATRAAGNGSGDGRWTGGEDMESVRVPAVIALSDGSGPGDDEGELELDEDFLRRIRDI